MIRGVLFDMDGVLLDTERISREILKDVCARHGYPVMTDALYTRLQGHTVEDDKRIMLEAAGADFPFDAIWHEYAGILLDTVLTGRDVTKPGLADCLAALKARGLRLALATSSSREHVEAYIAHIPAMREAFDAVICGAEAGKPKPAPDIWLEAARRLGLSPAECIGVEDSPTGLRSLTAAGITRVMIPDLIPCDERVNGLVDHLLPSLDRLPMLVDRLRLGARIRG